MADMPHEESLESFQDSFTSEELMSFMNGLRDGSVPMQPPAALDTPPTAAQEPEDSDPDGLMSLLDSADMPDDIRDGIKDALNKLGGVKRTAAKMKELIDHAEALSDQDPLKGDDAYCQIIQNNVVSGVLMAIETSPMHTPADKLRMTLATILTALKDYNISI